MQNHFQVASTLKREKDPYWLCYDLSGADETSRVVCNKQQIVCNTGIKVVRKSAPFS